MFKTAAQVFILIKKNIGCISKSLPSLTKKLHFSNIKRFRAKKNQSQSSISKVPNECFSRTNNFILTEQYCIMWNKLMALK